MNLREAHSVLVPPLIFGDLKQVRAVNFIVNVETLIDRLRAEELDLHPCPECHGSGLGWLECGACSDDDEGHCEHCKDEFGFEVVCEICDGKLCDPPKGFSADEVFDAAIRVPGSAPWITQRTLSDLERHREGKK